MDTGSSDNSKKIASAVTPCVYDFVWCDDFSAARNFAIQKAANDWILFLDSDEFVDAFDMPKLLEQLQAMPASIGHIHIKSLYENDGQTMSSTEPIARLFSRKLYHLKGGFTNKLSHWMHPQSRIILMRPCMSPMSDIRK